MPDFPIDPKLERSSIISYLDFLEGLRRNLGGNSSFRFARLERLFGMVEKDITKMLMQIGKLTNSPDLISFSFIVL